MWWATLSALTAAAQPMNPTSVRLDPGIETERLHELLVEARGREARAGGDDEVSDLVPNLVDPQRGHGADREIVSVPLEASHADRGAGKQATTVEPLLVGRDGERLARLEIRIAVLDLRPLRHAPEQQLGAAVRQKLVDEFDEGRVHVMVGHGRPDPVDISHCHDGLTCVLLVRTRTRATRTKFAAAR